MEYKLIDYFQNDVKPGVNQSYISNVDKRNIHGDPNLDFAPAFARILNDLSSKYTLPGFPPEPARILLTDRVTYHFYSTLIVNHPIELIGVGVPYRSGSTRLMFHGCSGIHIRRFPAGSSSIHLGSAYIQGLSVEYVGTNTEQNDFHGIIVNRPSSINRAQIRNFPGHGIHIQGTVQDASIDNANVSMTQIADCTVMYNGKSGVWIQGKDAQVMGVRSVNSFANGVRQIATDGAGFYDGSMLGNTYEYCHTRNNYLYGYFADNYAPGAPARSTYLNCYSEHSATAFPEYFQEGPSKLNPNCLVITSNGDGNLADAEGALVMNTTLGRIQFKPVTEVLGKNGISTITGDNTFLNPGDPVVRLQSKIKSTAYGTADGYSSSLFNVHDPSPSTRAWGIKQISPTALMTIGLTDNKHLRPYLPVAPKGFLIGAYPNKTLVDNGSIDGPRKIGIHDPRYENTLSDNFPNALVGDIVMNAVPNKGIYNFLGWIYAFDSSDLSGSKKWFRYGENMIGTAI
jgi:hypothetical protein